jgi:hypothetical protein
MLEVENELLVISIHQFRDKLFGLYEDSFLLDFPYHIRTPHFCPLATKLSQFLQLDTSDTGIDETRVTSNRQTSLCAYNKLLLSIKHIYNLCSCFCLHIHFTKAVLGKSNRTQNYTEPTKNLARSKLWTLP